MANVKVGISGGEDWGSAGDLAARVEEMGFDSIWAGEHVANWSPILSSVPVLATFAARTKTLGIGTSIMLFPLRHPTLIAKDFATIDVMSGGRLLFGIGIGGENPKEFEACGIPVKERGPRTNEGLQLVKKLWSEEKVTHKGRFFQMEDITIDPRPLQKPHPPIIVAGRKEPAMKRAARYGDGWFPYLYDPDRFRYSVSRVKEFAQEAGRDTSHFHWVLLQYIALEDTYEKGVEVAARELGRYFGQDFTELAPRYAGVGNAQQCLERLYQYYEAGVTHFVLGPMCAPEQKADRLDKIASLLLPQMRRF